MTHTLVNTTKNHWQLFGSRTNLPLMSITYDTEELKYFVYDVKGSRVCSRNNLIDAMVSARKYYNDIY